LSNYENEGSSQGGERPLEPLCFLLMQLIHLLGNLNPGGNYSSHNRVGLLVKELSLIKLIKPSLTQAFVLARPKRSSRTSDGHSACGKSRNEECV